MALIPNAIAYNMWGTLNVPYSVYVYQVYIMALSENRDGINMLVQGQRFDTRSTSAATLDLYSRLISSYIAIHLGFDIFSSLLLSFIESWCRLFLFQTKKHKPNVRSYKSGGIVSKAHVNAAKH